MFMFPIRSDVRCNAQIVSTPEQFRFLGPSQPCNDPRYDTYAIIMSNLRQSWNTAKCVYFTGAEVGEESGGMEPDVRPPGSGARSFIAGAVRGV
jgi:hypothetical protein